MIKRILLGALVLLALCSILLVAQIKIATYLFDNKMESTLAKMERKIPGLKLSYENRESTFTSRKGRFYFDLPLKEGNKLGISHIHGAINTEVLFGPLRASLAFEPVLNSGNFNQVFANYHIEPVSFKGAFKATAITPKLEGTVKFDSFLLPISTGICKIGENAISILATSKEDVDIDFKSAGVVCEGVIRYNNVPNYRLELKDVAIKFLPRIINKKPHFESIIVNFNNFDFKFSTLYALGFAPDENVKDISLQEAISFTNVSTSVTLTQPDDEGMSQLFFDNSGNYGFAFPYIKNNQQQDYYKLEKFNLSGELDSISIPTLFEASKSILKNADEKFDTNVVFKSLLAGFTDQILLKIKNFGYTHDGTSFDLNGQTTIEFDQNSKKPKLSRFDSRYNVKADRLLLEQLLSSEYKKQFDYALKDGQVSFDGAQYSTVFELRGKDVFLNNRPLQLEDPQEDALLEDENKATKAEKEQMKQEEKELQKEIEEARRAQDSLPSLSEGSLGQD